MSGFKIEVHTAEKNGDITYRVLAAFRPGQVQLPFPLIDRAVAR